MQLSKIEEQIMEYLWQLEQAYMKDILEAFPDPKPAATTVATHLMRMQKKEAIAYHTHGNSRAYYPLISKNDYFSQQVKGMINNFFGGSTTQFASFFTSATEMSKEELEDLRRMVDQEIKKKKP
ncbi:BlaI/MecI/CopY family transcriptional regulator [Haliscomenobacter sp.]|uniref:BlaI/MecI/CopY family transcriptional regulator n=1 Tax=Haliscomenobacter sp. TaxID=2717303 RepID=UPI003BA97C6A